MYWEKRRTIFPYAALIFFFDNKTRVLSLSILTPEVRLLPLENATRVQKNLSSGRTLGISLQSPLKRVISDTQSDIVRVQVETNRIVTKEMLGSSHLWIN